MRFALALLSAALALPATIGQAQLLPAGEFAARDGRPGPGKTWKLNDAQGARLAANINAVTKLTPIVIDYDHQTLRAEANGQQAPAAGWILSVAWRTGEGLFAQVDWTPAARARIEAKEYLYISPVIASDEAGNVTGVHLAALVNHPALLGMEAAVAQLTAQLSHPTTKAPDMDLLTALIAAGILAAGTDQAAALSAITALKARADAPPKAALPTALSTALGLQAGADEAAALSAVAALKSTDATTLATITALQGTVAALTSQINEGTITGLVDGAIAAHKLLPVQREWALATGRKDLAALQAYIAATPAIPGLGGQSNGGHDPGAGGTHALSTTQAKLAEQLGIDPKKYAEQLKATA